MFSFLFPYGLNTQYVMISEEGLDRMEELCQITKKNILPFDLFIEWNATY